MSSFSQFVDIAQSNIDSSRFTMRLYRFISKYISFLFVKLHISPNQVTVWHNILELFAVSLFLFGDYTLYYYGLGLLVVGGIMDNVDGEIARFTQKTSLKGVYFDLMGHRIIHPLFFSFASIGIYINTNDINIVLLGIIASLGYTISEVASNVYKQVLYDNDIRILATEGKENGGKSVLRWLDYTIFCFDHIKFYMAICLIFFSAEYLVYIYSFLFSMRAIYAIYFNVSRLDNAR
jgi:phosphatidylglycerophosphate synthase